MEEEGSERDGREKEGWEGRNSTNVATRIWVIIFVYFLTTYIFRLQCNENCSTKLQNIQ